MTSAANPPLIKLTDRSENSILIEFSGSEVGFMIGDPLTSGVFGIDVSRIDGIILVVSIFSTGLSVGAGVLVSIAV